MAEVEVLAPAALLQKFLDQKIQDTSQEKVAEFDTTGLLDNYFNLKLKESKWIGAPSTPTPPAAPAAPPPPPLPSAVCPLPAADAVRWELGAEQAADGGRRVQVLRNGQFEQYASALVFDIRTRRLSLDRLTLPADADALQLSGHLAADELAALLRRVADFCAACAVPHDLHSLCFASAAATCRLSVQRGDDGGARLALFKNGGFEQYVSRFLYDRSSRRAGLDSYTAPSDRDALRFGELAGEEELRDLLRGVAQLCSAAGVPYDSASAAPPPRPAPPPPRAAAADGTPTRAAHPGGPARTPPTSTGKRAGAVVALSPGSAVSGHGRPSQFPSSPSAAYTDERLATLFSQLDTNGNGWLDLEEFRVFYNSLETYGLDPDPTFIDRVLGPYGILADGKITYDEFSLVMLKVAAR